MNQFKFHVRKFLGLPVYYYYPRARIPAVTHLPVLMGLAHVYPIRSVLEFGAGKFSTISFLDRDLFPKVELVHSFETNEEWKEKVEELVAGDKRITLKLCPLDVQTIASKCNFSSYDLIFIDTGPARVETITEVIRHAADWKLVVIHDFENPPYEKAAKDVRNKFTFTAYCPHTGVLWNDQRIADARRQFRRMNAAMAVNAKSAEASDTDIWKNTLLRDFPAQTGNPKSISHV